MNKSQFYKSQCIEAASKSTMYYTLGSVIVKGGKVISTGYNHQRPNYDTPGGGKPLSMHAEMASIFNATRGLAPTLKQQAHLAVEENQDTEKKKKKQNNIKHEHPPNYNTYNTYDEQHGLAASKDLDSRPNPCRAPYAVPTMRQQQAYREPHRLYHHHHHHHETEYGYEQERRRKGVWEGSRSWHKRMALGRRPRLAKLNGADLYVCRVTRSGQLACSKPCWRCIEWCAWAGIKRIFHWSLLEQRFVCLKVGEAFGADDNYETLTDARLN
ncbi:CMP/dCMP-type deaminase domain-containing protein [Mycena indigotica]|uniref:CMP/dCMP-type deaminase domain-containing protein n=1 Tax=Mycena indigotica TaxID=2126181 RepID=A0A8H6VX64_9AGAR|nr:CMP/dCMP-type deaminase domain-containing protein [Mycena indigotica]KAF7297359.1 CMP/dCMP-type deaminase domain-containing protein [Mycena indigotica]